MPMTATFDDAPHSFFGIAARVVGLTALVIGSALAVIFAFAAAVVVGLMIFGAAIALRFAPRPAAQAGAEILEARPTPAGWVVETAAKRKS